MLEKHHIKGNTYDEERALYHLEDTLVEDCTFAGPADGESALKESRNITVKDTTFSLRYPLWHTIGFELDHVSMDDKTRAAIWYAENGNIHDSKLNGIKVLRECRNISLTTCEADSIELGWKCKKIEIKDCVMNSQYFLFEADDVEIDNLTMTGKYSLQYMNRVHINHSKLDTKDAFWHSKDVLVENSIVKGEYLGWYSENLTFVNCEIEGTQPLCYCKNLKLINCTMKNTDLSFEYSEVDADIKGSILSVKNPKSGKIVADEIGEIILENSIMEDTCDIIERKLQK